MRSAHKNLTSLLTIFLLQVALCAFCSAAAFLPRSATTTSFRPTATAQKLQVQADPSNFLFDDFRTYNGEVVDPYKILKLHRSAERSEIRTAYINLSRKYHPDVVRHKDVLPGSCNDLDDVRDQWERIKLAYEILSDNRLRKRYDRHEVIADPSAAVKRAAMDATGNAIKGMGMGMFNAGRGLLEFGAKAVAERNQKKSL